MIAWTETGETAKRRYELQSSSNRPKMVDMSATPNSYKYLEPRRGSNYRQLFIKDTRIRADVVYGQVVSEEEPKMTPEEVAADSGLPLEAVLEAVAYIESNPPEVRWDRLTEEALVEATGMNDPDYNGKPRILTPEERNRIEKNILHLFSPEERERLEKNR